MPARETPVAPLAPSTADLDAFRVVGQTPAAGTRRFLVILIKPSHYDADGYVIQWHRSTIPSNSLASVYGLLSECAQAKALGPDVANSLARWTTAYGAARTSGCAARSG